MNKVENFFNKMVTKEEWDNPDFMRFSNTEIPASDVKLGSHLMEIVNEYRLPESLPPIGTSISW